MNNTKMELIDLINDVTKGELGTTYVIELARKLSAREQATYERGKREILKWIQKYPNGTMTIEDKQVEYHAVPTNQVVAQLTAGDNE